MKVQVVDEQKKPLPGPYVVRLGGWTLEEYLAKAPDNALWEYARGEVVMYSPATAEHQDMVRFLLRLLDGYCEAQGWGKVLTGPAAIQILTDVVREPDIFVLPPEELSKAKGVPLLVRPALVIEVTSPSTRAIDLTEKAEDYAQAEIPEYWVVDPEQKQVSLHRLPGKNYAVEGISQGKIESRAVPSFWMNAEWLFPEPLPSAAECLERILKA